MSKSVTFISGTAWYLWNFRQTVIRSFVDDGWHVHVLAGPDDWSSRLAEIPGVTVEDWPVSLDGANPLGEARALRQVHTHLRRQRPEIVFNNGIKANVYGGIAARWQGLAYVNNISGLGMRMRAGDRKAKLLARLYVYGTSKASALLIQNPDDLSFLQSCGLPKDLRIERTMGSGVDLNHFQPAPLPKSAPRKLVFVGRLQEDKGIGDLVAAMQLLPPGSLELTVVGDTTHANAGAISQDVLDQWKDAPAITFVGRQSDVRPYLAAAHALVMPSRGGEGMPKTILEAAAAGRPAIVSDIDGCRACILAEETGWLAPAADPKGLSSVLAHVATLSMERIADASAAARRHAETHFSDRLIAELCLDLARDASNKT